MTGYIKNFVVKNGLTTGNITLDAATGNISGTNLSVTEISNLGNIGNVKIDGGSSGYIISTDGTGNLSFVNPTSTANPAPMPIVVYEGETLTIANNYQGLFGYPLTIDGTLTVEGVLIDVNDNGNGGGGGNGTPGGSTTQLQYNNAGSFGGISTATYSSGIFTLGSNTNVRLTGGSSGQLLSTDGLGNLSWVTGSGGGGGSGNVVIDNYTGNGVQTAFTLSATPTSENETIVNIDGVLQLHTSYSLSGNVLTLSDAPANGSLIEISTLNLGGGGSGNGTPGGSTTQVQFNDAGSFAGNSGFTFDKTTGTLSSLYFSGSGNNLSNLQGANVSGAVSYATTANSVAGANVSGAVSYATTANSVAGANVSGEVSYAATANAVAGANVSGAVSYATTANSVAGANVSGEVSYAATANAVAGANVSGQVGNALIAGTVYTNAQPNITSVGTLTSLTATGNIQGNYFIGNGSQLTGISAGFSWSIASSNATMTVNNGYFVDTTAGAKTMTLPASAVIGDTIRINDLAGTFGTNNLTVARNGGNIQGVAQDLVVSVNQSSFGLVYSNSTYGWKLLEL